MLTMNRRRKVPTRRSGLRVGAGLMLLLTALLGPVASADAGTSLPVLHTGQEAHVCTVVGRDFAHKAVFCTDLMVQAGEPGYDNIYVQTEAACQDLYDSQTVQCAGVLASFNTNADTYNGTVLTSECGGSLGPCVPGPEARDYFDGGDLSVSVAGQCNTTNPNWPNQAWTVTYAGSRIELPGSGDTFSLGSNLSSGHYYICA